MEGVSWVLDFLSHRLEGIHATNERFFDFSTTELCVHGIWDDRNDSCTCDPGWSTSVHQDALGGVYIWCNSSQPQSIPDVGSSAPPSNIFSSAFFIFLIFFTIIICVITCCWCIHYYWSKRSTHEDEPPVSPYFHELSPYMPFGFSAQDEQQRALHTTPTTSMYRMPVSIHMNSNLGLSATSFYHNMPTEPYSAFFTNEPYNTQYDLPMGLRQAAVEYYRSRFHTAQHLLSFSEVLNESRDNNHGEERDADDCVINESDATVAITDDVYRAPASPFEGNNGGARNQHAKQRHTPHQVPEAQRKKKQRMSTKYTTNSFYGENDGRYNDISSPSPLLTTNQVVFCVNPILFQNCGILLEAPSGLTTSSIMRLRQESPNRTAISLAMWTEIATKVIGLRDAVAYSIFDVVYALTGSCIQASLSLANGSVPDMKSVAEYRHDSNRALLKKMGGFVDEARWPTASALRQVSIPALIIFLLAQLILEQPPRSMLGEISQELVMSSVRQHLHDYITAVAVTRSGRLTVGDAQELRILLREFVNGIEQPFGTSIGFLWPRSEKTIDITILSQFIRPRIMLPSELAAGTASSPFSNNVIVRGLHGAMYIPPCPVMTSCSEKLMLSSSYTIEKCSQSNFYITSDLPHTRLSQLVNCTVALGPVGGILCVDRCENSNISAMCAIIVVTRCRNVTIFVCTNSPPVLCLHDSIGMLENVRFAPYNSHYSTLEEHLAKSGVNPKLNLWNVGLPSKEYILPPDEFTPLCFPVAPHATAVVTTRTNPCPPPRPYAAALERRVQRFQEISKQLQEAYQRLEKEGYKELADELRVKVHKQFIEWLRRVGQEKGLINLLQQSVADHL